MSRYRKVDPRIWNDAKFRELSNSAKLVFFMLLTHPSMTALGAMRATIAGLAEELGWETEAFREAFLEGLSKGMAEHDPKACLVALPNFLRYNPPESPNVVKAWVGALDLLPECDLKTRVIARSRDFAEGMSNSFAQALPEAFGKGMPNQEQEQEQEQEKEKRPQADATRPAGKEAKSSPIAFSTFLAACKEVGEKPIPEKDAVFDFAEQTGIPEDFLLLAWREFGTRYRDSAKRYRDWRQVFRNAVRGNWFKLWYVDDAGQVCLTSQGRLLQQAHREAA